MTSRRLALVACLVVAALVAGCSPTFTMRLSQSELQADLAKKFPREVDKHVVLLRASDPQIDFPGKPNVAGVRMRLEATTPVGSTRLAGTARLEGSLEYVEPEHAFYVRNAHITELMIEPAEGHGALARLANRGLGHLDNSLVQAAVRTAVEEILNRTPVYVLDARRSEHEAKAIRHLRSVRVDGNDLVLKVGI